MLGRQHEEGRSEERVRAGGEHGIVDAELLAAEHDLGALRAADPVLLHRDHVRRPLDRGHVGEQPVRVLGDAEEPLLELLGLDLRAAALAAPVDHLLVGQHGGVLRAPLDRGLLAVGEAALVEAQEDPLGPAVVLGLVGAELARPVDRHAPLPELLLEGRDRRLGRLARVLAGLDRVVLGRQPERVVAHRVQHAVAVPAPEVGDRVAHRVRLQMADVRLARRVGQHLEHVGLGALVGLVRDLPGALVGPYPLPARLDRLGVVAVRHPSRDSRWLRPTTRSVRVPRACVAAAFHVAATRLPASRPSSRAETSVISATSGCGPPRPRRTRLPTVVTESTSASSAVLVPSRAVGSAAGSMAISQG